MNNNIFSKLTQGIPQQFYGGTPSSFKIRGTLVEKTGDTIKVNIGGDRILEAEMKERVKGEIGETIIIDKKDILKSKLYQEKQEVEEASQSTATVEGEEILKQWNLPINEETKGALKALEKYGIEITKENLEYFIASKANLEKVIEGLDYETAIKLMEKNIDVEGESLQRIVRMLEETKGEKEGFSLLKFFSRKKNMTPEEAEKKALQLYGNEMGKDITDVIKALHKAGMEVTRSNVEKVNNIFNKLENLQNIEEHTIINALKNKIETTIDHLYKLKNAITKNTILAEEKLSQLATKAYGRMVYQPIEITAKDLKAMEENIRSLLTTSGIEVTEKIMVIAKELIRNGLEVSRENIERVEGVKGALKELKHLLNYERTAHMLKTGLQVEKENIVTLVENIKENIKKEIQGPMRETYDLVNNRHPYKGLDKLQKMREIVQNINLIGPRKEALLCLLMKNAMPINLKEVNNLKLFLNNKQQIAMETDKILKLLEKSDEKELKDLGSKIKEFLKEATDAIKSGKYDVEKTYQQLGKWIKEVGDKAHLLGEVERETFQKRGENLRDSLNLQSQLNKEDTVLQLPVMMENHVKNLQIYIMNKKKSSRKIDPNDMSLLLNFDTNNMGNINIYTSVNYKKVNMKIGVKSQKDKKIFQENQHRIEELLLGLGYELKEMTFRVEEEQYLLTMAGDITGGHKPIRNFFDIKI